MQTPQKNAVGRFTRARMAGVFAGLIAVGSLVGPALPNDARADGPPPPGADAQRHIDGCPLEIGRLRVRTWVESDARSLSIRFASVSRDLARCLELPSLALIGPTGHRVEGKLRRRGLPVPVTIGASHVVPAKIAPGTSTRDLGAGVRFRIPFRERRPPIEYRFDLGEAPGGDRLGRDGLASGWSWRGVAYDACSETHMPLWIAVDELEPCH